MLGGDLPLDVAEASALSLPPILIGRGERDTLYPAAQLGKDLATLEDLGLQAEVIRFDGGHEWAPGFLGAAGHFLEGIQG